MASSSSPTWKLKRPTGEIDLDQTGNVDPSILHEPYPTLCYTPYFTTQEHISERVKRSFSVAEEGIQARENSELRMRNEFKAVKEWWELMRGNATFKNICHRISSSPLGTLLRVDFDGQDRGLIHALAERWWDTTHTFHLPFGEMTITPLDMYMLTGLAVGVKKPVPFDPWFETLELAQKWLGDVREDECLKKGLKSSFFVRRFIQPLKVAQAKQLQPVVAPEANSEGELQYVRSFLFYYICSTFFNTATSTHRLGYLAAVVDPNKLDYDWGGAALSYLYHALNSFVRSGSKTCSLGGCAFILQYWAWEYLALCTPILDEEGLLYDSVPFMCKWDRKNRQSIVYKANHNLYVARGQLELKRASSVNWQPWIGKECLETESAEDMVHISKRRLLLVAPGIIERIDWLYIWYLGERCWRQLTGALCIPTYDVPIMDVKYLNKNLAVSTVLERREDGHGWPSAERNLYPPLRLDYGRWWKQASMGTILPPMSRSVNFDIVTQGALRPEFGATSCPEPSGAQFGYMAVVPEGALRLKFGATSCPEPSGAQFGYMAVVPEGALRPEFGATSCPGPSGAQFGYMAVVPEGFSTGGPSGGWFYNVVSSQGLSVQRPVPSVDETVVSSLLPGWKNLSLEDLQLRYSESVRYNVGMRQDVARYTREMFGYLETERQISSQNAQRNAKYLERINQLENRCKVLEGDAKTDPKLHTKRYRGS